MNSDAAKAARNENGAAPAVVDLRERVPQMTDAALTTLQNNALRLKDSGSRQQQMAAELLLPAIEAEFNERRAQKRATQSSKRKQATSQ
jgi:hypothetical protein